MYKLCLFYIFSRAVKDLGYKCSCCSVLNEREENNFPDLSHGCLLSVLIVCVYCVCVLGEDCPSWMVPISICASEDPSCSKIKVLLDQPELTVTIPNLGPDKWVKVRSLSPCMCADGVTISIVKGFLILCLAWSCNHRLAHL